MSWPVSTDSWAFARGLKHLILAPPKGSQGRPGRRDSGGSLTE